MCVCVCVCVCVLCVCVDARDGVLIHAAALHSLKPHLTNSRVERSD